MLFERGADSVGFDFLAHPFWDKYIEFEERQENKENIIAILGRIIHIPLHQYARYFDRYRTMIAKLPIKELVQVEVAAQILKDLQHESGQMQKTPVEMEQELRSRVDPRLLEVFHRTQAETTKRWTYEQEIKRPYYHVTELDDAQLANWRKYLDFEEAEGDYLRTKFLYERCLVTCANYDEFWYRYVRWTLGQTNKAHPIRNEEARNIYRRASYFYISIFQPEIRLHYARLEESLGKADIAVAIHEAILSHIPGHLETIISLVNTNRRQNGFHAALGTLQKYINDASLGSNVKGSLVAEWARLLWKVKGDLDGARGIFQSYQQQVLDCRKFWIDWLEFEKSQPTSDKEEKSRYERVKSVYESIRTQSQLQPQTIRELSSSFLSYLDERGDKKSMTEWTALDAVINGPNSILNTRLKSTAASQVGNGHG